MEAGGTPQERLLRGYKLRTTSKRCCGCRNVLPRTRNCLWPCGASKFGGKPSNGGKRRTTSAKAVAGAETLLRGTRNYLRPCRPLRRCDERLLASGDREHTTSAEAVAVAETPRRHMHLFEGTILNTAPSSSNKVTGPRVPRYGTPAVSEIDQLCPYLMTIQVKSASKSIGSKVEC